ncbi:hypothetical protein D4741_11620 [Pseudoalteromonas gelatinilytica]|uniref:Uncharacterized protein n=1 Tax=Pseudoalteromonas gelatinilytica TaxID=1703256 RepID=A0A3A3F477_9GAMM|nr:hypothetical protein D4741_11620 [Pseudoalteromonas profundi]
MQKVRQCRSNCRAQLNEEIFALLSTRFYCLKLDHLIKRIGIKQVLLAFLYNMNTICICFIYRSYDGYC